MGFKNFISFAFAMLIGLISCEAKRILLMAPPWHSHLMEVLPIGENLITDHGHEVYVILHRSKKMPPKFEKIGIKPIFFGEDKTLIIDQKEFQLKDMLGSLEGKDHSIEELIEANMELLNELSDIHLNEKFISELKKYNFDFAIMDGSFYSRYFLVIAHLLQVPYGCTISILPLDLPMQLMTLPSYSVPDDEAVAIPPLNFWQRYENAKSYYAQIYVHPKLFGQSEWVKKYSTNERPFSSMRELAAKTKFWIHDRSPMLFPVTPRAPNVFVSYGLTRIPVVPLPADIKKFADDAKDGLVVISFGGIAKYLPSKYTNEIAVAISKLPKMRFIWRLNMELDVPLPSNLKAITWLPQNDILAHPNTKLFITHCGNNGITEALTHGVPMLGMPIQTDQPYNCKCMKAKGYGEMLKLADYDHVELKEMIEKITRTPSYYTRVKTASKIINSQPNPAKSAALLAHQVIEFGDEHIKNSTNELYWFQFLMWDFAFLIFLGAELALGVVFVIIRVMFCRSKSKQKQA